MAICQHALAMSRAQLFTAACRCQVADPPPTPTQNKRHPPWQWHAWGGGRGFTCTAPRRRAAAWTLANWRTRDVRRLPSLVEKLGLWTRCPIVNRATAIALAVSGILNTKSALALAACTVAAGDQYWLTRYARLSLRNSHIITNTAISTKADDSAALAMPPRATITPSPPPPTPPPPST
jgi:hypothetical protein